MNAGRNNKLIEPVMGDMPTVLAIKNCWHSNVLTNRSIVSELEHRLELLNNSSIMGKYIIIHISFGNNIPSIFKMIDNFDLFSTLITPFNCVVDNIASKPIRVIKVDRLVLSDIVVDHIIQEVGVIENSLIYFDSFREIGNFDSRFHQIFILVLGIICIGDIKIKVISIIFKDYHWNLVLSKHHQDRSHSY